MRNHRTRRGGMRLFMPTQRRIDSKQQTLADAASVATAAILVAVMAARPVHAQVSVATSLTSEYSARGKSLSKGRPAPQLRIDVDAAGGWYAGALLSRAALPYSDTWAQALVYGGFAQALPSGLSWEAGALDASFVNDDEYHYHEFYAGLARERVAARVYFSPSYYGGGKTMYAEVNASYPLRDRISLIGHLGVLHPFSAVEGETGQRLDMRLGLGLDAGNWNVQLALLANAPRRRGPQAPRALVLSATYGF